MAEALLGGVLAHTDTPADSVCVVELSDSRREQLAELFPGVALATSPKECEGLVLAIKPHQVVAALADAAQVGFRRGLSIAAGITTEALDEAASGTPMVRSMPNTPSLVGAGAAAICGGATAGEADLAWAESILSAVGIVERVPESLMDAVTGLSGSGPAYIFLVAEALVEAGVLNGLPRPTATRLAHQMLLGSARMLVEGDSDPHQLRAAVTSPGGTTAAGLAALESRAVRSAIIEAVTASTRRAADLG